jgi:RND family efflux transporter MFP subunit
MESFPMPDQVSAPVASAAVTPPPGLAKAGLVTGVAAMLIVAGGIFVRSHDANSAQQWSNAQAMPTVHLIEPAASGQSAGLLLPGTLEAWNTAKIFARVPGYVHAWYRDIGDHVGAGTPLGAIDTPELDQQIIQARAALARAVTEETLARTTAARWQDLLTTASVSRQEVDEKKADYATHAAAVREAQANLGRLLAMKAYATVRAPFAGEVTTRSADIGDLVGPGASTQQPMFAMADEHRIRVYVNVPQQYAAAMHPGMSASLSLPEAPGKLVPAQVIAASGAVNSQNGAFQVQLVTDNPGGMLKSGGYAQVSFKLPGSKTLLTVPASSLVLRGSGTKVATVDRNGRVQLLQVVLGRDLGGSVEVVSGLGRDTGIIDNPPDSIANGEQVRVEANHG